MKKMKRLHKGHRAVLFARGITEINLSFINKEVERLGYRTVGEYLNDLIDLQRQEAIKDRRSAG